MRTNILETFENPSMETHDMYEKNLNYFWITEDPRYNDSICPPKILPLKKNLPL